MPWYNSDRVEPGKMGNLRCPSLLARQENVRPFRNTNESHNFTFVPRQAANRECIAEIPDSYLRWGLLAVKRLGTEFPARAELHRLYDHRNVAVSGCTNDGNARKRCLKLLSKIHAAQCSLFHDDMQQQPSQSASD